MYSDWVGPAPYGAGLLAVLIWLGILTYLFWQQRQFLRSLFPKSGERDIRIKFVEVLAEIENFKKDLGQVEDKLAELQNLGQLHIQRVELIRFNPYGDTGGDISFSLALLDDKGTGFVLTSLHARSGTRIFAKPVLEGKADKYQFSKEEEQVVKKALGS